VIIKKRKKARPYNKDGRKPRGTTLTRAKARTLQDANNIPHQITPVQRRELIGKAFRTALWGPFTASFHIGLAPAPTLLNDVCSFTSPSKVYNFLNLSYLINAVKQIF
jgi:hypothetical protein